MSQSIINILSATSVGDYRLHLQFDDGTARTVDFLPFLSRSRHPAIRAWLDRRRFGTFRIEYGELIWGDYELCFPIMDLHRGEILHGLPEARWPGSCATGRRG